MYFQASSNHTTLSVASSSSSIVATSKSEFPDKNTAVINDVHDVDNDDSSVKETSEQQRWPSTDEPVCIMCGKFGEYICDETDEDVCSLQCKTSHLAFVKNTTSTKPTKTGDNSFSVEDSLGDFDMDLSFDDYYRKCSTEICENFQNKYTPQQLQFFREKFSIKIKSAQVPAALMLEFKQCAFPDVLKRNLQNNDYVMPTPVQMQVIPTAIYGDDVLVSAATSSGKTASFLLPIIHVIHQCVGKSGEFPISYFYHVSYKNFSIYL